jgi:hypothetical protein
MTDIFHLGFCVNNRFGIRNDKDIGVTAGGSRAGAGFERFFVFVTRVGEVRKNVDPAGGDAELAAGDELEVA